MSERRSATAAKQAARLQRRMAALNTETRLVVVGDINVAATNSDVFHPDAFRQSTHVTQPEREALGRLLESGLVDVDVARWGPEARRFTWWKPGFGGV